MTVKTKLILALSVILITTFLSTSLISYTVTRDAIREELLHSALPLTGKNIYSEINDAMMRPLLVSSSMANDTFFKNWVSSGEKDQGAIEKYLTEIKKKYGFLTAFFVSVASDKYYYQDGVLKRISPRDSHDVWFFAFTRSGKEYQLDVDVNESEDRKLTIFANFRVEDDRGRLLGVTGVGMDIDHVRTLLDRTQKEFDRDVFLVDQDGLIQVHPDETHIERHSITKMDGISSVAATILAQRDEPVFLEYDWQGEHYLLTARYLPELQWFLVVQQDEQTPLKSARNNLIRTLVIGGSVSCLVILLCAITINHFQSRLEDLARTDPLTGAANRRALEDRFRQAAYKADRYSTPFSVIIIDLNEFKAINDTHGHLAGDAVLKRVATAIAETIRPSDLLARWGGDEFIILLDGEECDALGLAERLLSAVADNKEEPSVTFCHGLAEYAKGDDLNSLTMRADQALYQAKASC